MFGRRSVVLDRSLSPPSRENTSCVQPAAPAPRSAPDMAQRVNEPIPSRITSRSELSAGSPRARVITSCCRLSPDYLWKSGTRFGFFSSVQKPPGATRTFTMPANFGRRRVNSAWRNKSYGPDINQTLAPVTHRWTCWCIRRWPKPCASPFSKRSTGASLSLPLEQAGFRKSFETVSTDFLYPWKTKTHSAGP